MRAVALSAARNTTLLGAAGGGSGRLGAVGSPSAFRYTGAGGDMPGGHGATGSSDSAEGSLLYSTSAVTLPPSAFHSAAKAAARRLDSGEAVVTMVASWYLAFIASCAIWRASVSAVRL